MDPVFTFLATLGAQLQSPTLAFLIGGMVLAALGSRLEIPDAVHRFIVVVLLLKIGLGAGIAIRRSDPADLILPALAAMVIGAGIVAVGWLVLTRVRGLSIEDGAATAGLFGAVSASTLAASMVILKEGGIAFEAWLPALYPFMDIPALLLAIVLSTRHRAVAVAMAGAGAGAGGGAARMARAAPLGLVLADSLRGGALSALVLGLVLGLVARPDPVFESFFEPLFRGFLSLLMLAMGLEAFKRLADLRKTAHVFALYALFAPLLHGLIGFGVGCALHVLTGFSPGGVVLLAVMAASSSDISGPPTMLAAIPRANPAAYLGASTGIGTPVALLSIPLWIALVQGVLGA